MLKRFVGSLLVAGSFVVGSAGAAGAAPSANCTNAPVVIARYHDGQLTILADTRDSGSATDIPTTFHVAGAAAISVTVVYENRTIPVANGTFTDTFAAGSTVHIYQVNG